MPDEISHFVFPFVGDDGASVELAFGRPYITKGIVSNSQGMSRHEDT